MSQASHPLIFCLSWCQHHSPSASPLRLPSVVTCLLVCVLSGHTVNTMQLKVCMHAQRFAKRVCDKRCKLCKHCQKFDLLTHINTLTRLSHHSHCAPGTAVMSSWLPTLSLSSDNNVAVIAAGAALLVAAWYGVRRSGWLAGWPGMGWRCDTARDRALVVVITGSSRGLGFCMAQEFLALGDRVVVCGRSSESVNKVQWCSHTHSTHSLLSLTHSLTRCSLTLCSHSLTHSHTNFTQAGCD